jgi:signal transduction histidine kinase
MSEAVKPGSIPASEAFNPENGEVAELTRLVAQIQFAAESERSALAKELHDELGGLITAAKMDMQWLSAHIGGSLDAAADEKFKSVMQMLNQAMTLKRRVVESLRPSLLDHFGLAVAMRSHFDERCRGAGIDCVASLPEESLQIPRTTQLALFRVAEHALAAALARGGAKNVELVIEPEGEGYVMQIGDDGAAPDESFDRALAPLRYRIESAGGTVGTQHRPGAGNQVRVYVPRSPGG